MEKSIKKGKRSPAGTWQKKNSVREQDRGKERENDEQGAEQMDRERNRMRGIKKAGGRDREHARGIEGGKKTHRDEDKEMEKG